MHPGLQTTHSPSLRKYPKEQVNGVVAFAQVFAPTIVHAVQAPDPNYHKNNYQKHNIHYYNLLIVMINLDSLLNSNNTLPCNKNKFP